MVTETQILQTVGKLNDPEIGRSFSELDMLDGVTVSGTTVTVRIQLPTPAYPQRERITQLIQSAVKPLSNEPLTTAVEFSSIVRGNLSGGAIGLRVKNVIAVGSGKGGVGKSTVAATLAFGLKTLGAKVGLMDADVYGPSIPHMIGSQDQPKAAKFTTESGEEIERIQPVTVDGVKVISMGYFVKPDQAVIWRGPLLHRAITQFLKDTDWGELDYLIIDLPPGTGDIALTLSQMVGLAGAVVVCTPQQVALLDAVKAISMYKQVKIPLLGVVENMTGDIFGRGGAKAKADELHIPFLGELPIDAGVRIRGDAGKISALFAEENPSRQPLLNICEQVAIQVAKQLLVAPKMPTLEIL